MYEFPCYLRKYTNLRVLKDVDNLIETTAVLTTMFWGVSTKPPTIDQNGPTAIQRREIASALCQDIRHVLPSLRIPFEKNAVAFLKTFSLLHTLVSRDGHDTRRESIRSAIVRLWGKLDLGLKYCILPPEKPVIRLIHLGIEGGSQVPFLALYSSSVQASFIHRQMYLNSNSQESSSQCTQFLSLKNRNDS